MQKIELGSHEVKSKSTKEFIKKLVDWLKKKEDGSVSVSDLLRELGLNKRAEYYDGVRKNGIEEVDMNIVNNYVFEDVRRSINGMMSYCRYSNLQIAKFQLLVLKKCGLNDLYLVNKFIGLGIGKENLKFENDEEKREKLNLVCEKICKLATDKEEEETKEVYEHMSKMFGDFNHDVKQQSKSPELHDLLENGQKIVFEIDKSFFKKRESRFIKNFKKVCFGLGVGTEIISGAGFGTGCVFGVLVASGNKFACGFVSSAFNVLKLGGSIGVGLGFLALVGGGIGLIIYGKSRSGRNRSNITNSFSKDLNLTQPK